MLIAAAPLLGGVAMKIMRSRKQRKSEASSAWSAVEPDEVVTESPVGADEMGASPSALVERYDHRTPERRLTDRDEDAVIDQPIQPGAAELRAEVAEAEENGDLENDPRGSTPNKTTTAAMASPNARDGSID